MSVNKSVVIDEILESILRGSAKILGCNSANLVVFNEFRREVRIRVGLLLKREKELGFVERILGGRINDLVFSFEEASKTELYRSWNERSVIEVSKLADLARGAFPDSVLRKADEFIGKHRFLFVPILGENSCYGVIIFEKVGDTPFSPQQREVLILYAKRIGEIIDNDAISFGLVRNPLERISTEKFYILFDKKGKINGGSLDFTGKNNYSKMVSEELINSISDKIRSIFSDSRRHENNHRVIRWSDYYSENKFGSELECFMEPVEIGRKIFVLCEIRKTEKKHERSIQDHLLQIALEKSAPALLLDPQYRITTCNEATASLLGYKDKDLYGKEVGCIFEDSDAIYKILNHQFLFISDGHYEETAIVRKKNGERFHAKVEALLLVNKSGRVVGYLILIRKNLMKEKNESVDDSVNLMRMERLATMGELAGQLAHEIRNPILAIGATLETLSKTVKRESKQAKVISNLSKEIERLDIILRDYLSLAGKHGANISRFDLRRVIDEAQKLLIGLQTSSNKKIVFHDCGMIEILGDFDGLKQVFFNLFLNSIEASPRNSIIECRVEKTSDKVSIIIDDSGCGLFVEPERYFVPFFSTKPNGTGLGLTVCRKIIYSHSGSITLSNRAEGGCRAVVTLPIRGGMEQS